jgi:hypothetical protein
MFLAAILTQIMSRTTNMLPGVKEVIYDFILIILVNVECVSVNNNRGRSIWMWL